MELIRNPEPVAALIRGAETIALCSHVSPDGDTLGSTLALKMGLESLGKRVSIFCQDPVPAKLSMLPGAEQFRRPEDAAQERFDLLIAVDVSDQARMGTCQSLLAQAAQVAQVDHHGTNPAYAQVNDVDPHAPATSLLVKELLDALHVTITRDMAICLYTAVATDTGNFAFSYTTAEAFSMTSELMGYGLPLSEMNRLLFRQRTPQQLALLSRALNTLAFHENGQITTMRLSQKDFIECGALPEHADAVVNYGVDIVGVKMAMMAREDADGTVKIALRAIEPTRVDGVAFSLGGGGHAQASGCTVDGPLDAAIDTVLSAMKKALNEERT